MLNIYDAMHIARIARVCSDAAAHFRCNLSTGVPFTQEEIDARFPLNIALMHSELSEALEGHRRSKMDDHLPNRPSAEVELADAVIRILEVSTSMGYDIGGAIVEKMAYNSRRADHKTENRQKHGGKKY
jgi:hypothetical protein